jgi:hypothetical protein
MDFCYVWLRNLVKKDCPHFVKASTRDENELTGNDDMSRGIEHFTKGLSGVFSNVSRGLKKNAPLVFTYHHNDINAYFPVAAAILDSGLSCTKVLPCPAEMGASIHIKGTDSSIVDTIFVCRKTTMPADDENIVFSDLRGDIIALSSAPYMPTKGDIRCMAHGHIIRHCVNSLLRDWERDLPAEEKLKILKDYYIQIKGSALLDDLINIKVELPAMEKEYQGEFAFV